MGDYISSLPLRLLGGLAALLAGAGGGGHDRELVLVADDLPLTRPAGEMRSHIGRMGTKNPHLIVLITNPLLCVLGL